MVVALPLGLEVGKRPSLPDSEVYKSELKWEKVNNKKMVKKTSWPVKLFWFPYDSPSVISLGFVSSSFLLQKRRRLGQGGCLVALDVNPRSPPGGSGPPRNEKSGATHGDLTPERNDKRKAPERGNACSKRHTLGRQGRLAIRFFERELGVKRACALPSRISCGHLRSAVRSCFISDLEVWQELSLKTVQKLEKSYCRYCSETAGKESFNKWKEDRFRACSVDTAHIELFRAQFGRNVDFGWNRRKYPYIPNGHACLGVSRCDGGTWLRGEFTTEIGCVPIVSAGKPRVVTLHSEYNTSVLHSLHRSLYASVKRKGWLLVGSPTNKLVSRLGNSGDYVSVDYKAATDNIKTAYTRAAIEVLIDKGEDLGVEDIKCLRAVGTPEYGRVFERGQPMGSLVSFPLLCLINKTVVDLALNDLLNNREVTFKEWTSHRCLVNGDDLLYRDFSKCPGKLLSGIKLHGSHVGLVLNEEKTMVDPECGEINSTVFRNGVQEKKSNVAALFMGEEVADVIGYAHQACREDKSFMEAVWVARNKLASQVVKMPSRIPYQRFNLIIRDSRLRPYLLARVRLGETHNNFPVETIPDGFDLSREEIIDAIHREVDRLRELGRKNSSALPDVIPLEPSVSLRSALRHKKEPTDRTLSVLVSAWKEKQYKKLRDEDSSVGGDLITTLCGDHLYSSGIEKILCFTRSVKKRWVVPAPSAGEVPVWGDYLPLD